MLVVTSNVSRGNQRKTGLDGDQIMTRNCRCRGRQCSLFTMTLYYNIIIRMFFNRPI